MNVEQALRALAADDAATQVPAHVDATVMAAWDAERPAGRRARSTAAPSPRLLTWAVAGACVVAFSGIAFLSRPQVGEPRAAVRVRPTGAAIGPDVAPAASVAQTLSKAQPPSGRIASRRPRAPAPEDAGYVLVPDMAHTSPELTVMRVRMPRTAFARLGIPIANPDGEGMVDVEVLVGEDGVARSIRRAAAVGWAGDN